MCLTRISQAFLQFIYLWKTNQPKRVKLPPTSISTRRKTSDLGLTLGIRIELSELREETKINLGFCSLFLGVFCF